MLIQNHGNEKLIGNIEVDIVKKYTLSQYPSADCLTYREKCKIFRNFLGWDLGVVFQPEWHQGNWLGI